MVPVLFLVFFVLEVQLKVFLKLGVCRIILCWIHLAYKKFSHVFELRLSPEIDQVIAEFFLFIFNNKIK